MNNISGTIITNNEEDQIKDCILSLKKICNEIIVVDSLSSDSTVEIAKELGAQVIKQNFLGDGPQKALASSFAKNDWVFSLDADERLEDDLITFINKENLQYSKYDGYSFRRRNFSGKRWIRAAGFYPDRVVRLYNKKLTNYDDRTSHSSVLTKSEFKSDCHITHHTYSSYTEWIEKINFYSTQSAKTLHTQGVQPSNIRPITHSIFAFFKKLFFKRGIFQGIDGFTVALTTMFNTYMKYMKLNELHQEKKDPKKHFPEKDS
ncbi:MAG: glycosyltransferase family 2 protein [Pseudomonadota bacterium]|nr:glycosyltransferase family 2 protein [Pseudomonadota bacterium]